MAVITNAVERLDRVSSIINYAHPIQEDIDNIQEDVEELTEPKNNTQPEIQL